MAAAVWAATPDEADYAIEYKVTYTGSVDSGANNCTMNLRDQANANVNFTVQKFGHGPCRCSDRGTILHGRREESEIWLLRRAEKGHPEVEPGVFSVLVLRGSVKHRSTAGNAAISMPIGEDNHRCPIPQRLTRLIRSAEPSWDRS